MYSRYLPNTAFKAQPPPSPPDRQPKQQRDEPPKQKQTTTERENISSAHVQQRQIRSQNVAPVRESVFSQLGLDRSDLLILLLLVLLMQEEDSSTMLTALALYFFM